MWPVTDEVDVDDPVGGEPDRGSWGPTDVVAPARRDGSGGEPVGDGDDGVERHLAGQPRVGGQWVLRVVQPTERAGVCCHAHRAEAGQSQRSRRGCPRGVRCPPPDPGSVGAQHRSAEMRNGIVAVEDAQQPEIVAPDEATQRTRSCRECVHRVRHDEQMRVAALSEELQGVGEMCLVDDGGRRIRQRQVWEWP